MIHSLFSVQCLVVSLFAKNANIYNATKDICLNVLTFSITFKVLTLTVQLHNLLHKKLLLLKNICPFHLLCIDLTMEV